MQKDNRIYLYNLLTYKYEALLVRLALLVPTGTTETTTNNRSQTIGAEVTSTSSVEKVVLRQESLREVWLLRRRKVRVDSPVLPETKYMKEACGYGFYPVVCPRLLEGSTKCNRGSSGLTFQTGS